MNAVASGYSKPLRGAIVAMTRDRVIGLDGDLPWHYSADLKRFKQRTIDSIIIMGRITWESIGSKPLPRRRNIVVSRNPVNGAESYTSVTKAIAACGTQDCWVIGGGQVYQTALPELNLLDVTLVPDTIESAAAVQFPEIDPATWCQQQQSPLEGDPRLVNTIYTRCQDNGSPGI